MHPAQRITAKQIGDAHQYAPEKDASDRLACPMDQLLRLLMGPWTTYILWVLRNEGPTRFGALKRLVPGVSAKVLTERLRMLEQHGLITRSYAATIPPQVTYSLARRGEELNGVLQTLADIAIRWRQEEDAEQAAKAAE